MGGKLGKHLTGRSPIARIGPYATEEYLQRVKSFHGAVSPGALAGGIMLDMAMAQIPKGVLFDVICETSSCLPDAVQLLTPCTIGNGWLRIVNLGRFAVNLYDKHKGNGVRVYLDPQKLDGWNEIQDWFLKLIDKHEQSADLLREQILLAGRDVYTMHPIQIKPAFLSSKSKGNVGICGTCGEAYPLKDGASCLGCQGKAPYDVPATTAASVNL
jgi:formylmethanofuran dehydrogenase subunit E